MAQCFLLKRDMLVWTIGIYGVLYFNTFKFCAIFTSGRFIAILWFIASRLNTLSFFLVQLTYLTLMFKLPTSTHCTQTYAEYA